MMMLRILPANADMLKHLRHPNARPFLDLKTPVEWPMDQFTIRRLAEGAIVQAPKAATPEASAPARPKPAKE
jgi:hypothetical protein